MANVVAVYDSAEEARAAMTSLQRHGVEGAEIALGGPAGVASRQPITNDEMRAADEVGMHETTKRVVPGALLGVVLLGAIGAAVGWVVDGPNAALVAGIGGAAAGLMLGFFYGGASGLPANDSMGDTFAAQGADTAHAGTAEAWVEVHTDGPAEQIIDLLRGTNATDVRVE